MKIVFQIRPENQSASLPYSGIYGNVHRATIGQVDLRGQNVLPQHRAWVIEASIIL